MVKAIVGACWGDEGKGKITDVLAEDSDIVVRFQGGSNAGHTIINEYGKFALHQLPSGVFRQNITNIIGNGVALSVENFLKEVQSVVERGVPTPKLLVSDRCQVVMPYHKELDGMEEARLAAKSFGSTKSGIAPFYSDKYAKIGFQVSDLFDDKDSIMERIDHVLGLKNVLYTELYHQKPLDREEIYEKLMEYKEALATLCGGHHHAAPQRREGGQDRPAGGPAGLFEGPGPGHLSHGHLLLALGGLRLCGRRRHPALRHPGDCHRGKGLLQRCGRRRVRQRNLRRRGRGAAAPRRRRRRVRRHHRASPPHGLAGPGGCPLRLHGPGRHGGGLHRAGTRWATWTKSPCAWATSWTASASTPSRPPPS